MKPEIVEELVKVLQCKPDDIQRHMNIVKKQARVNEWQLPQTGDEFLSFLVRRVIEESAQIKVNLASVELGIRAYDLRHLFDWIYKLSCAGYVVQPMRPIKSIAPTFGTPNPDFFDPFER